MVISARKVAATFACHTKSSGNSQYTNRNGIQYGGDANIMPEIYADEMYGYNSGAPFYGEGNNLNFTGNAPTPTASDPSPSGPGGSYTPTGPFGDGWPGTDGLGNGGPGDPNVGKDRGNNNKGNNNNPQKGGSGYVPPANGGVTPTPQSLTASPMASQAPSGADGWLAPSASGPAWTGNEAVAYTPGLRPYADVESAGIGNLIHQYGTPDTWGSQYGTGQNGLPTINGLDYTGANHEFGGNPAIDQFFQQNGMTPEDLAHFLIQGETAARDYSNDPANIAAHAAQGQDVWGNQMNINTDPNFLANLKAAHAAGQDLTASNMAAGGQGSPDWLSNPASMNGGGTQAPTAAATTLPQGVVAAPPPQAAQTKAAGKPGGARAVGDRNSGNSGGNAAGGGAGTPGPGTGTGGGGAPGPVAPTPPPSGRGNPNPSGRIPGTQYTPTNPQGGGNNRTIPTGSQQPGNGQAGPRIPPTLAQGPGDANQAPGTRTVGPYPNIVPGPNGHGGNGVFPVPDPANGWQQYDWGSGGASGNREAAGQGAFNGYRSLVDNPDVPKEIQDQIIQSAARDAASQYAGQEGQIQRYGEATGATAGIPAAMATLGRNQAETQATSTQNAQIQLEQERERRLESGLSGLSGMYGTETGYMNDLTQGRSANAYKPRVTGGSGASQGSGTTIDWGQIASILGL